MKRYSVTVLAAALAAVAFAEVKSSNTFAQMSVMSSSEWTLLALPWVTPGGADNKIVLTNLVLTTGLSNGDKLMHYNGSTYEMWTVSEGKWIPAVSAGETGITQAADPSSAAFSRGIGVWLKRSVTTNPILLYGQTKSDAYGTVTVPAGATALVACPKATDLALSAFNYGAKGDRIKVSVPGTSGMETKMYYRQIPDGGSALAWCDLTTKTIANPFTKQSQTVEAFTATTATIPSGLGFFYTNAQSSALEIAW